MKEKGKVEKRIHTFFIQERLYETIKANYKPGQLDYYLYVIDKINRSLQTDPKLEYVELCSRSLQGVMNWRNYSEVMDNLVYGKLLERKAYGAGKCYSFRISR